MIPWLDEFRAESFAESPGRPIVGMIASIDDQGRPRVRSVVCRRIDEDGSILFATDGRSEKIAQIRDRPEVEISVWLAARRQQYRFSGTATILDPADRRRAALWKDLSDAARALFAWPEPGAPRADPPEAFARAGARGTAEPGNFVVVEVRPDLVDHLDLNPHPHRRRRWSAIEGWAERPINP